jgi:protein gp37
MNKTGISWSDATWNPWVGCEHVSPGCDNCYMFSDMRRYGQNPEVVRRTMPATFSAPLKWVRNNLQIQRVFTCSWSDFFITDADEWRSEAWEIIRRTPQLTYQILTKRPVLIQRRLSADWGEGWPNCWLGVTVESRDYLERLNVLRRVPAAIRFASFEPVLEDLGDIDLTGIHWAIIGGESGPGMRPCSSHWIVHLVEQCTAAGVACFVKQGSAFRPGQQGGLPDHIWAVKEFPPAPVPAPLFDTR